MDEQVSAGLSPGRFVAAGLILACGDDKPGSVASCFERDALKIGFEISPAAQSLIQLRQAIVPPPGEARPDTDIVFDLAARLGCRAVLERRY